jgi:hypothetical protein
MDDFLSYEDCIANVNIATIAGKVTDWKPVKIDPSGMITALSFTIGYQKTWPNGGRSEIPIRCYVTGTERVQRLNWLNDPDPFVLVHGEVTDKGAVYAHQVEWLSRPPRAPGEGDAYLSGVLAPGGAEKNVC